MPTITTTDGVNIFYKDWGSGQPIVFSHGWPLSADDWDAQMMFFLRHGYRVIAHDRRGHGRSDQPGTGNDMDHWVADLAALTEHLDLRDAIHIGHSTGGGEVARYVARHQERVAKAVLVASLTPNMVNRRKPCGQPPEWFDAIKAGVLGNRSEFYRLSRRIRSMDTTVRGQAFGGGDCELVAPGHGRQRPGPLRDRLLLAGGLHRRSEEDHRAGAGHAWRSRPDRPVRQFGAACGRPAHERGAEDISWLPAWHADHPRGRPQPRPARVHQILTDASPNQNQAIRVARSTGAPFDLRVRLASATCHCPRI